VTRIIAGRAKGRRLLAPRGQGTRPTASRVKQTLFDILAPRVRGCRFLDLCAGTGAVGLEALSRGAAGVVLVEQDERAVALIRRNVAELQAGPGEVGVRRAD
jgi:16S rRNA (guanine966-N2)-methyltransferase